MQDQGLQTLTPAYISLFSFVPGRRLIKQVERLMFNFMGLIALHHHCGFTFLPFSVEAMSKLQTVWQVCTCRICGLIQIT